MASYYNIAGSERLEKWGEWVLIDSLAKTYNYTHDQVFALSWSEAMTMIAYNREAAYVENKAVEIRNAAERVKRR